MSTSSFEASATLSNFAAHRTENAQSSLAATSTSSRIAVNSEDGFDVSALKAMGISTFLGNNTGAIASWYRSNNPRDSTNGRSWCQMPYNDAVPGFAPSLKTMLASFDQDSTAAKRAFCGLEAKVYSPATRKTVTLFIADAFDDKWVRTPASIDVMFDSFASLFGRTTHDKNDVVKDVSWRLTGKRNEQFTYEGVGSGR
ncbi:hypothetical protein JCM3774_001253 [Rhodotorula dairenensis]